MKFEVLQENLTKALTIATRVVSSKPHMPLLSNVLLEVSSEGGKLTASNVESMIQVPFGAKIDDPGELAVPARTFQELVASLSPGKITLETKEGTLLVSSGKFKNKINCVPASDFPKLALSTDTKIWSLPKKTFDEALNLTLFSSAVDEGRAVLNGVLIRFGDLPKFVSTDGFRLSQYKLSNVASPKVDFEQLILPAKALAEVIRLVESEDQKEVIFNFQSSSQVVFQIGDILFQTQTISGNYPEFEKIIPSTFDIKLKLSTEELAKAIKTAAIFARENANIIRFVLSGSTLTVKAQGGEVGENESEIDVTVEKGDSEDFSISFNFRYLLDFLATISSQKELSIEFGTQTSPTIFRPEKIENYLHIIMPVRVQS